MKMKRKYVMSNIKKYRKASSSSIVMLVMLGIIAIPLTFVSPAFFSTLIDKVMYDADMSAFSFVITGMILVYVSSLLLDSIGLYCSNKIQNDFIYNLRKDVWNRITGLSYASFEKYTAADMKMRMMDDVNNLGNFVKEQIVDLALSILMTVISLVISFKINWQMTVISIVLIPVMFFINNMISNAHKKVNERTRELNDEYYNFEHESLQMWKDVKLHNMEDRCIERFGGYRKKLAKLGYDDIKCWVLREIFSDFRGNYMNNAVFYGIGALFVINEQMSVGMLFAFTRYIGILINNTGKINDLKASLNRSFPYYKRIFETLSFKSEKSGKVQIDKKMKAEMKNVFFRYDDDTPVIEKFNLTMNTGDFKILAGKSGCGKTTVSKILLGLYKPIKGSVQINGCPLSAISRESFYKNTGAVMQDSYLFNMTVKENLLMAKPDASEEELIEACIKADIWEHVNGLERGWDTVIGEKGVRFSGGQRQKIAIARALLKQPKLLILDEATSSLDKVSEDKICRNLKNLLNKTAVFMISHKPSVMEKAKEIIYMEEV